MPIRLVSATSLTPESEALASSATSEPTLAFVNNMPDGAFEATERQFLGLVEAGSHAKTIGVTRFCMDGVPRGDRVATYIAENYRPLSELVENTPPDLLIVTGSNPIEREIRDEPYWKDLSDLLSWARDNVPSVLLSCLSAHAALTVFDGIERHRLPSKRTGVFAQDVHVDHQLTAGIPASIVLPHSRQNSAEETDVREAGYDIVVGSEEVGWSIATKRTGQGTFVLVQGHPEYDPSSLLREYQRDVGRYVRHERDELPCLPYECVGQSDWTTLQALHEQVVNGHRDPALVEAYPFGEVGARAPWPWRDVAVRFYTNWLDGSIEVKD